VLWAATMRSTASTGVPGGAAYPAACEREGFQESAEQGRMAGRNPLRSFVWEWACYLAHRGHNVKVVAPLGIVRSRNGKGAAFRWLLLHSRRATRTLTAIDHESILNQLRLGQQAGQQVFVAIKFERPVAKVVVLPAASAARMARVGSDKGGITWDW
jgi:hypothetical protein